MSGRNTFTKTDLELMGKELESSPAPERPMTKSEALDALAPQLKTARVRGHTLASLVAQLATLGLKTHARAISESIGRLDAVKPTRVRSVRRKAAKTPVGGQDAQVRQ